MDQEYEAAVHSYIKEEEALLNHVSQEIWKNPELKYEEKKAHELLTGVLNRKGFSVHPHYVTPTAFRAEYSSSRTNGPTVAVICEYDALPEVGHACGHNLIAESGLGAGLAVKAVLERFPEIPGKIVVLGTPAEEGGGGKIDLINAGAFKDIDIALMVHPGTSDHLFPPFIGIGRVKVTYIGKEAHASGYPWQGINALDAAVAAYNNVALLRQHIKPNCRIHGIITNGGVVPNIIPARTDMEFYYRAATSGDLEALRKRVEHCCTSAAEATGCKVSFNWDTSSSYKNLISSKILAELYGKYSQSMGTELQDGDPRIIPFMASSDMGNVSHVVPSIHPTYRIGTEEPNHSVGFTEASGAPAAQPPTIIAAKSMALTALEVMCSPGLLKTVKQQFKEDLIADSS